MPRKCLHLVHGLLAAYLVMPMVHATSTGRKSDTLDRRFRRDDLGVIGQQINSRPFHEPQDTAAYFSGKEIIEFQVPVYDQKFTIELWLNPEGGQLHDVPILNFYNRCYSNRSSSIWKLGVRDEKRGQDSRFYFSMKTHRVKERYTVTDLRGYRPGIWTHIAVVFNGTVLELFVNQAQVAVSHMPLSPVTAMQSTKCEILEMGGDSRRARFFHGTVDDFRIWKKAKSQRAIIAEMFNTEIQKIQSDLLLFEKFTRLQNDDNAEPTYLPVTKFTPTLVPSTAPSDSHHIELKKPFCGVTICDNPDIIKGYKENNNLRLMKELKYRIINLADDNGNNPILTQKQIKRQHQHVNHAFSKYNITWNLNIYVIKNSTLRNKVILLHCSPRHVGDGTCHKQCDLKAIGNDGGDCLHTLQTKNCKERLIGNGKCDMECNNAKNDFDGGECCDVSLTDISKTCFDYTSPNRVYMSKKEFQRAVSLSNKQQLNVYAVSFANKVVEGYATFPWEKSVFSIEGGTLLQAYQFGKLAGVKNMVHELGHNLGLWHVHHRSSDCDDPCLETHASMELGDLCGDTNPTQENDRCEDPKGKYCGIYKFKNTPFMNYMGYATQCSNEFTPDQVSRMHCYADFMYQTWRLGDSPSSPPMAPKILSYSNDALKIEWIHSLGLGHDFTSRNCNLCDWQDTTLKQFAIAAYSGSELLEAGHFPPHQAVGPPDARKCNIDAYVFMNMDMQSTTSTAVLELVFEKEVVPTGIKIWITYSRDRIPFDLELLHVDKSITYLGSFVAQCDVPYTRRIFTNKAAKMVRIQLNDRETGIDAVQLISEERHPHCEKCPRIEYIVHRHPPFQSTKSKRVFIPRYVDRGIQDGVAYEYRIQTVVGSHVGPMSSPLRFHTKLGFCGDGIIQHKRKEECDDGNLRDGDGCSIQCKREEVFKCKGQPSICYKYEADGICEAFEKKISPIDCGFYVPDGFSQQWAATATGNPKHKCPHSSYDIITGPPPLDLKCYQMEKKGLKKAWIPCGEHWYGQNTYWIEAGFAEPVVAAAVVIYLASDGLQPRVGDKVTSKSYIRIKLKDEKNVYHSIGVGRVEVHCKRSPLCVPVLHDMTKPYYRTTAVRVSYAVHGIAISSIALQSSNVLNPAAASSCDPKRNEYYNPKTHTCHPYDCHLPKCKPLVIKNAQIACEGNNDGNICKVKCNVGYLPGETKVVKCVLGTWKDAKIKCEPVDCGKPKIKRAIIDCDKGTMHRSICKFHCIRPSRMVGVNNKITCLADGLWSAAKASCNLYCAAPSLPDNSYTRDYNCDVNHMKARRKNEMGTECKFQCMLGFVLAAISSNVIGKYGKATCNEDGIWTSDSKCIPIQCKELSGFDALVYNCSNGNNFRSVCRTICPQTKEVHEVQCQEDGKWSSNFNHCRYFGSCSRFSDELMFDGCNFNIKGSCKPSCKQKGFDVVLRGNEQLQEITFFCMPDRKWYPPVESVYCMESCNTMALGDGICDCKQNNKHCNYDNGDCCLSTLKGTRLVLYSDNVHCECIDPNVAEARSQVASGGGEALKRGYGDNEGGDDEDEYGKGIDVVQTFT